MDLRRVKLQLTGHQQIPTGGVGIVKFTMCKCTNILFFFPFHCFISLQIHSKNIMNPQIYLPKPFY